MMGALRIALQEWPGFLKRGSGVDAGGKEEGRSTERLLRIHGLDGNRFGWRHSHLTLPMNSDPPSQQDSTMNVQSDATMQELKAALQSAIVPLAGVWVAAGKALISGDVAGAAPAKPLETW